MRLFFAFSISVGLIACAATLASEKRAPRGFMLVDSEVASGITGADGPSCNGKLIAGAVCCGMRQATDIFFASGSTAYSLGDSACDPTKKCAPYPQGTACSS